MSDEKSSERPEPFARALQQSDEESGLENSHDATIKDEQYLDGWRGWIVVAASASALFVFMGVIYSWGILQADLARKSNMSLTTLTFVGSLATSFMTSICIFVGKAVRRFGYRETAIAGAIFLGLGEFASSWVTHHLGALFVTHGVIFGVGGGLTILPCSTAPLKWFRKRRGLATGIVFGGGSLGAAVMGVATNSMVGRIGAPWTFRVLGFMLWAVCLPAACLLKQPASAQNSVPKLQWQRFRDVDFLIVFFGSSLACFPLFVPPYFIPVFARSISQSGNTAIIGLTIWNITSTFGRVCAGYTADSLIGPLNSFLVSMICCAVSSFAIWPFASNMGVLAAFAAINGIGCGSFFSLFPTVLGSMFGQENTMGVLPLMWGGWFFGFFFLQGTPIAAQLYALAGSRTDIAAYRPAAFYAGAILPKTTPIGKARRKRARQSRVSVTPSDAQDEETWVSTSRQQSEATVSPNIVTGREAGGLVRQRESLTETHPLADQYDKDIVGRHIRSLPPGIVMKCLNVFTNKFPELAILHLPSFISELRSRGSKEAIALLSAILAVTRSQICVLNASWGDGLLHQEHYALYAKDLLRHLMLQSPNVQVVQALLVITQHEWGTRDFHKAWIYCGVAVRIMQALHSLRVAPYPLDMTSERKTDATSEAIETRTYWACFIMDCMVNSGTYNPPMLSMSEMNKLKIPRPVGVVEFAFGPDSSSRAPRSDESYANHTTGILDITQGFEILVAGFDIWKQLMAFIFQDGRRAPGMCAPPNCPWVPGSPWFVSRDQLENWRANQHRKLYYPNNSVAVHMTLGYGETFTYLNLLYYVSTLMLHREYFPFLPTLESTPQGPVDHPMLEATAPEGWWDESARILFGAAENIARILHESCECGVHLMTPFAGFCAFSAGYLNLYVYHFPRMNLGRSPQAKACMDMCLDYLNEFRKVWTIADGWIKTIQHASLLYSRAVENRSRYQGRTRTDFDVLHQSIHEFRGVDRSDQHTQEIDGADISRHADAQRQPVEGIVPEVDTNTLLTQLLAEVSSNLDEQGAWSQWWPPVEEVSLPPTN
ncbi:putative transporter MCH4 [Beauveria bassiana D1-5]|uniref:Putative transporter MCH4 n=1 Tax=Beauveria bassiana D1-5 TaxID=1245745 RepID=A0A0A2VXT7_BEABA|nr:putative transporter MCH4 [Beauveria bassiana D1-5]